MTESDHNYDQNFDDFNFDEMSNDAAVTQFYTVFNDLVDCGGGTPEDLTAAVDELIDTLTSCVTKKAALEEMVGYILESAAGSRMVHYMASDLLAQLISKFRREIEGESFALILKRKIKDVFDRSQDILLQQAKTDVHPAIAQEGRNMFLFLANLAQKILPIEPVPWAKMQPALVYSLLNNIKMSLDVRCSVRKEYLDNCLCAVQALKIVGSAIDEAVRKDPSITEDIRCVLAAESDNADTSKFPDELSAMYDNLRNMLISNTDLTPSLRANLLKILEARASRWGDVPTPDKPFDKDAPLARDEVDPVFYGSDGKAFTLSKEEEDFCNQVADEVESYDEEEVDDQGELQITNGEQPGDWEDYTPQFVYRRESIPDAALEDFRRMHLLPKQEGSGDYR